MTNVIKTLKNLHLQDDMVEITLSLVSHIQLNDFCMKCSFTVTVIYENQKYRMVAGTFLDNKSDGKTNWTLSNSISKNLIGFVANHT